MYCTYNSPIGLLNIFSSDKGICKITYGEYADLRECEKGSNEYIEKCVNQLELYFKGQLKKFSVTLDVHGTPFQMKVWSELKNIPYGNIYTYKQLAERIGNIKAYRAVGHALNKNPVPIIIPCHRVVGSNGDLIGFALGLDIKEYLLRIEQINA